MKENLLLMLQPCFLAVSTKKNQGGLDKYVQKSVQRFSIPWTALSRYITPFIKGHKATHTHDGICPRNSCTNLVKQKNSALINAHFVSYFSKKEKWMLALIQRPFRWRDIHKWCISLLPTFLFSWFHLLILSYKCPNFMDPLPHHKFRYLMDGPSQPIKMDLNEKLLPK